MSSQVSIDWLLHLLTDTHGIHQTQGILLVWWGSHYTLVPIAPSVGFFFCHIFKIQLEHIRKKKKSVQNKLTRLPVVAIWGGWWFTSKTPENLGSGRMVTPRIEWLAAIIESGFFSFAYDRRLMDCVCWRDPRRERWLVSQNSSFECIKRKPFWHRQEAKEERTGIGDRIFIVHWSPALIHIKLLSSAKNDTVLCRCSQL